MYAEGLDVVVVNYRTPELLHKFCDSYAFQESEVETELLVVDVDPDDKTDDAVRSFLPAYDFLVQYWPISFNCGYAGACNFASASAIHDTIAFFNADTELHATTLQDCYDLLHSNDSYGVVGPMQVNSEGRITHAGIFGSNTNPSLRGWMSRNISRYTDVRDDAVSVSGSAYFIKRSVWDKIENLLKQIYPDVEGAMLPTQHYYEETFVSYMARHLGYKVVYAGNTMMSHEWNQSGKYMPIAKWAKESRETFRNSLDYFGVAHD